MKTIRHSALRLLAVLIISALAQTALDAGQSGTAVSDRSCRVVNVTQRQHFPPDSGQALADAIASANPDDQLEIIGICRGTYLLSRNIGLTGIPTRRFPIPTLDGAQAGTTLRVVRGTSTLTGLTITGGNATNPVSQLGGGIDNHGDLTLISCVVIGNRALHSSGGIENHGSLVLREGAVVSGNVGHQGGGIGNFRVAVIESSTVVGNIAEFAGGILNGSGSTLTIDGSTVTGNFGELGAGGISNTAATLTVRNSSTVSNNRASRAGGIWNVGTLTVDSSTLNGNTASAFGGGIENFHIATLNFSTVSGNEGGTGGGIYNHSGAVTLNSSLVTTNTAIIAGGGIYNASGSVTLNLSDVIENIPENCVGVPGC